MSAKKLPDCFKKTKVIKIMVTEDEFERYNSAKLRLMSYSPPLRSYDILKYCVAQIDDLALIQLLRLDKNSPIRVKLLNDYLLSQL